MSASQASSAINVVCTLSGKSEAGLFEQVCGEFVQHLALQYPDHSFQRVDVADTGLSLSLIVRGATRSSVNMKLLWTKADGTQVSGKDMGLSFMDRDATPKMRMTFYQRVTAATPMPN